MYSYTNLFCQQNLFHCERLTMIYKSNLATNFGNGKGKTARSWKNWPYVCKSLSFRVLLKIRFRHDLHNFGLYKKLKTCVCFTHSDTMRTMAWSVLLYNTSISRGLLSIVIDDVADTSRILEPFETQWICKYGLMQNITKQRIAWYDIYFLIECMYGTEFLICADSKRRIMNMQV